MNFATRLDPHIDSRGKFVELIRNAGGQVSFSTSAPGVTRGDHYHTRKIERFIVTSGSARIRLRHVDEDHIWVIDVDQDELMAVDIPPKYVHNITNIGGDTMHLILWCNESYDPLDPDTKSERVERETPDGSRHASRDATIIEDFSGI